MKDGLVGAFELLEGRLGETVQMVPLEADYLEPQICQELGGGYYPDDPA